MKGQTRFWGLLLLALLFCMAIAPAAYATEDGAGETPPVVEQVPPVGPDKIKIDYVKNEFTGVNNTMEYMIGTSAEEWTGVNGTKLAISANMYGKVVRIRYKKTQTNIASEPMLLDVPAPISEDNVRAETRKFTFDYFKNTLVVSRQGAFEVTTDAAMSKWQKVTSDNVSLSKLVSAGVTTIRVRYYADNKAERFTSADVQYTFYAPGKWQSEPTTGQVYYDGQTEVLTGRNGASIKGLEISYDKGVKWAKISSNEVKLASKLNSGANEVWVRTPANANEPDKAPSRELKFSFAARPAKPADNVLTIHLADDSFTIVSTAYEYQIKGQKAWIHNASTNKAPIGTATGFTVRVRAVFHSDTNIVPASLGQSFTPPKRAATPKVSYNAKTSQVTGVIPGMQYYVTTEKITDKNFNFQNGVTVTAPMMDSDGSFNVNDDHNGPKWNGRPLHGLYLHVKTPADLSKNVRESLVSISTFIPARLADVPSGRVVFDKMQEVLTGIDSTMEYRLETESKWITGPGKGDVSVAAYLDKSTSDNTKVIVRMKGSGKAEDAIMASRSLAIIIGQRGPAPSVSFDFKQETLTGVLTDDKLAAYQVSLDGKKWQTPTRESFPTLFPKYVKSEESKTLHVRLCSSASAVASKPAKLTFPCRPQTPAFKVEISSATDDAYLDLKGMQASLQVRRAGDTAWETPTGNLDFSQGQYLVSDTMATFEVRVAATTTRPASLIQSIKVTRPKAPNVKADYKNGVFTGATEKMQYRIGTREGENINTYSIWLDVSFPGKTKKMPINFAQMGNRNVQFRVKAVKSKPASPAAEPIFVMPANDYEPDITIRYNFTKELLMADPGDDSVVEYMLRMTDESKQKWTAVPKTGIKLSAILNDTSTYVKENGRAIIKFRLAATGSGDDYEMPSASTPEYLVLGRIGIPYALYYDYEDETIGKLKSGDIQYSTDKKNWKTIKKADIKSNRTSFPATAKEQVIYLRRSPVRTGSSKGFASDPLQIRIPAAAKPPELDLEDIVDFEETGDDFALRIGENYEFMLPDTTVNRYRDVWISGSDEGLPLQESGRVIYDGKKSVKVLIRYKGSNEYKHPPSQTLELVLPKGKK